MRCSYACWVFKLYGWAAASAFPYNAVTLTRTEILWVRPQKKHEVSPVNSFDETHSRLFATALNIHLVQSEASGALRGKKALLGYFQQGCTVQSHSHFQSPRLNPLTGEGVCLRIALTAGACLSVLAMPSKKVLADLH